MYKINKLLSSHDFNCGFSRSYSINDTKAALREMEKEISNYYFEDRDEILDEIVTEKLEVEEYSIFKKD